MRAGYGPGNAMQPDPCRSQSLPSLRGAPASAHVCFPSLTLRNPCSRLCLSPFSHTFPTLPQINFDLGLYTDAEGNVLQDKVRYSADCTLSFGTSANDKSMLKGPSVRPTLAPTPNLYPTSLPQSVNDKLIEAQDPNRKIRAKPTKRNGMPLSPGGGGGSGAGTPGGGMGGMSPMIVGMMGALLGAGSGAAGGGGGMMSGGGGGGGGGQQGGGGGGGGGGGEEDESWEGQQQRELARIASDLQGGGGGGGSGGGGGGGSGGSNPLSPNAALQSMLQQAFPQSGGGGGGGMTPEAAMWVSVSVNGGGGGKGGKPDSTMFNAGV